MTKHDQFSNDLKAYSDGELNLFRRAALRQHLLNCSECRKELAGMSQITEELKKDDNANETPINSELKQQILKECKSIPLKVPTTSQKPKIKRELVAAATCLFIIFSFGITKFTKNSILSNSVPVASSKHSVFDAAPNNEVAKRMATPQIQNQSSQSAYFYNANAAAQQPIPDSTVVNSDDFSRRVHKEATITIEVDDPEAKSNDIQDKVRSLNGIIGSSNLTTDINGRKTAEMQVKVPVTQFETMLKDISKRGDLKAKNVTGEDITEKVSDADQREQILRDEVAKSEKRLRDKGKKASWEDNETARDLRIQLAQARARLVLLKKLGDLSTINITLTQKPQKEAVAPGFWSGVNDNTKTALNSAITTLGVFVNGLIWILIYLPLWLPLTFLIRYLYRRFNNAAMTDSV